MKLVEQLETAVKKHDPHAFRLAVESSDWLKFVQYLICTIRHSFRIMSFAQFFFFYIFFFSKIDKTAHTFVYLILRVILVAFYKNIFNNFYQYNKLFVKNNLQMIKKKIYVRNIIISKIKFV